MLDVSINSIFLKQKSGLKTILKDISFSLPPNKIFTILGKNGSGKSTLIKSLTGLLDKRFYKIDGEIIFNSKDILTLNEIELLDLRQKDIKYVFQDAVNSFDHLKKIGYYFDRQVYNIDEIDELLDFFVLPKLKELFKLYPYEVSGGMAQRLSLILVLITHPKIIILDEPTSGMDSPIANLVLLRLKEFVSLEKNSILLVTQDLFFAKKISDKIAVLNDTLLSDFISVNETNDEKLNSFFNSYSEL